MRTKIGNNFEFSIFFHFLFFLSLSSVSSPLAHNVPAAWRSWGINCTQFGLSPPVKGHNRNTDYHFTPNFAKPLVRSWLFLIAMVLSYSMVSSVQHYANCLTAPPYEGLPIR